jgi:hypothetical protein
MNSGKLLTWLIPVAALLVPGFLFYNWWSSLNSQSRSDLEKKVRSNPGLAVFMGSAGKDKLKNPLESQNPAAPAAPIVGSTSAVANVAPVVSSGTAFAVNVSSQAAAPVAMVVAVDTAAAVAASSGTAALVAQAAPGVVITRDPTLSPYDVVRLQQMELEAKMRSGEIQEATKRVIHKHQEPPIEDSIELQGIVELGNGNNAIINGETVGEGDFVGKAKVLRITNSTVFFVYKGRKFTKSINK